VALERSDRRRPRDNTGACRRQRPPFALLEPSGLAAIDANVGRKRQVDERNEAEPRTLALRLRGHRAKRETVDDNEAAVRNRRERSCRGLERHDRWPWKRAVDLVDVDNPATSP